MEFCKRAHKDSVHVPHLLAVHRRDQTETAVLLDRLANYLQSYHIDYIRIRQRFWLGSEVL